MYAHDAPHTPPAHDLDRLVVARYVRAGMRAEIDRRTVWTWSALVPSTTGRLVDISPYTSAAEAQDEITALYRERDPHAALCWTRIPDGGGHVLMSRASAAAEWTDTAHSIVPSVRSLHGSCTDDGPTGEVAPPPSVVLDHADLSMLVRGLREELGAWVRWYGEYGHEADTICTSGCFGGRIAPACADCIDKTGAVDRAPDDDLFGDLSLDFGDDDEGDDDGDEGGAR